MNQINVEEAQRRLPELLKRAAGGERITINDHGRSVEIVAAPSRGPAQPGFSGGALVETCAKVRGLAEDLDFSRNPSTGRSADL